ncbi:MAG TPA: hypothetical protein VF662_16330 [Allosphingosinicella sp.]|jgi:hypothetical protein
MIWLKLFAVIGMAAGAWQSFKALGTPIIRGGKRWYLQSDGRYRRWYGGRARSEDELS